MNPVRFVVIGVGAFGKKQADLIDSHELCTLAAICDTDPQQKAIADCYKVPFYQDVEKMLRQERPDGAFIVTPNAKHLHVVEICARYSVDIFIEKPIADTMESAQRIIELTDQAGIQVLVGQHRRYNPLIQKAKEIIESGQIGKLVAVNILWTLLKPIDYYSIEWHCKKPGGGPALINLIHDLDSLRYLCGEIRQVFCHSSSSTRELEVEDSLAISLSMENGALCTALVSDATTSPWSYEITSGENPYYFNSQENCYLFSGTLGSLAFPKMELWNYEDESCMGWQHPMKNQRISVTQADPLANQLEHFCQVVRGNESPLVGPKDATRTLKAVLAVLESADKQLPVDLT